MDAGLTRSRLVAIVGPTASGKSDLALLAASQYSGEVVSCDSVQVYRGLDIGSGKPTAADRASVPHHMLDLVDLGEEMNAGRFAEQAAVAIEDISRRGHLPLVTGGTGLYLTALLKGLFVEGSGSPQVRSRLDALAHRFGSARLHRVLVAKDPEYAARTKPADRVRVVRALEVCFVLGRPFSRAQQERRPAFLGEALIIGLHPARDELLKRVSPRVSRMFAEGLVDETRRALANVPLGAPLPRALGAIGYRQVAARLAKGTAQIEADDELQRAIVISTMQYAKRQMTYFRHQFEVEWFTEKGTALRRIGEWLGNVRNGEASQVIGGAQARGSR